jgi:hypothetical protein
MSNVLSLLNASKIDVADIAPTSIQKKAAKIPVAKPNAQAFFRVHLEWHAAVVLLEWKREQNYYFVKNELWSECAAELKQVMLYATITLQNDISVWPVKLSENIWSESAREAAELAKKSWIRLRPRADRQGYDILLASGSMKEPAWPEDTTFDDIVESAFKGRVIDSLDHPVLKALRGEVE